MDQIAVRVHNGRIHISYVCVMNIYCLNESVLLIFDYHVTVLVIQILQLGFVREVSDLTKLPGGENIR